ncbi:MAG: hypothetical protein WBC04_06105 [Candidatus Acidiferrales bacterium]
MLKHLYEAWKRLAHRIGDFQARVLLTLIYVCLVLPIGVAVRFFADPLRVKCRPDRWLDHPEEPAAMKWARRQW